MRIEPPRVELTPVAAVGTVLAEDRPAPLVVDHARRRSARLHPWLRVGLMVATVVLAAGVSRDASDRGLDAPDRLAAVRPVSLNPAEASPFFAQSWVADLGHTPSAHSSTICLLPGGDLFSVWFGGSREGANDVALYSSRRSPGQAWSKPEKVVDRALAQSELDRRIKKVGNAVVFPDRNGMLWMIYVTVSVGGWSGSALNIKSSPDEGRTWSESQRLTVNPFLNLSSLVRHKPIYARDGRIGVPIYHEMAVKFPQMLWLTPGPNGTVADYRVRSLGADFDLIQPTLVPLKEDRVLMLLRDGSAERKLRKSYSHDNGWTWSETEAGELPNPDSAVDALQLRDGRILLAYNHAVDGRENLRLAISSDEARTWLKGPIIEAARQKEYSYPHLVEDAGGRIHLTYTWQRERIRHVEFNVAWLDAQVSRLTGAMASFP